MRRAETDRPERSTVPHTDDEPGNELRAALAGLEEQMLGEVPDAYFNRLPLVSRDGTIWGYCLAPVDTADVVVPGREKNVQDALEALDLDGLAYTRPVIVPATMDFLDGSVALPRHDGVVGLMVPTHLQGAPGLDEHLRRLRASGVLTVMADYRGGERQDELLPVFSHVVVNWSTTGTDPEVLAARASTSGACVIGEGVLHGAHAGDWLADAHLVVDALYGDQQRSTERQLTPSELVCLEVVRLLSADEVDSAKIATTLGTDPAMTLRLLHLVNAPTEGLSHRVDSLNQAIVLLGPVKITGLVMASLISSTVQNMDNLWLLIARGAACRALADGDDAAYTIGLLSALSHETGIPASTLVERTRLSPEAASALILHEGPLGRVLAAVVAHEHHDTDGVRRSGHAVEEVALAYLQAIPWALATVLASTGS